MADQITPTNLAFLRIAKRAERQDDQVLNRTFVDYGSVFATVSSLDHQIVFGRRGTGKTHLLTVLRQSKRAENEVAIQLDMRNLGSAGGLYADPSVPLAERATRLLVDVLAAIHQAIFEQAIESDSLVDLSAVGRPLDELFDSHTAVRVVGDTTVESSATAESGSAAESKLGLTVSAAPQFGAEGATKESEHSTVAAKKTVIGKEVLRVNFGNVGAAMRRLSAALPNGRLWLLIDEWSEVPLDLQPLLADLLRRAVLPVKGVTVKIAAIEQRSHFLIPDRAVGNVGIELGADVSAALNLDDFMVFDNDEARAVDFFRQLVYQHVKAALEAEKVKPPATQAELISMGFTQANAFDEVVRACEGVPRDAINILFHAAQRAGKTTISVGDVRTAARQWYIGSKDAAVSAHGEAKALLTWIVDQVIKERQTKAFLLEAGTKDRLIDFLYDERVLHVLRRGISAQDEPGKRYNVYGIDYGCYVDLINTARAPQGVLDIGSNSPSIATTVPRTDLRSTRRCILRLDAFHTARVQSA
ncbi:MAG: hypothetical protein J0M00_05555 [Burkholderiales bacterium]|jgi:hypothetical protein|nr:hypothetical protein [Burkholderiales bacterium]